MSKLTLSVLTVAVFGIGAGIVGGFSLASLGEVFMQTQGQLN